MQDSTFIGPDVHKATISEAVAQGEGGGGVRLGGQSRTVRITSASGWRSWLLKAVGCVLALPQGLAAMACTGNSLRWATIASSWHPR